jgi:hypothetical protein
MTVQHFKTFYEEHWDWGFLKNAGCFGKTPIEPTDVDGMTERRGYCILIEAKKPGAHIKQGQQIVQKSLINTGVFSVVNMWGISNHGKNENPEVYEVEILKCHLFEYWKGPASIDTLVSIHKDWFNKVEALPYATEIDTQYLHKQVRDQRTAIHELNHEKDGWKEKCAELIRDPLIEKSGSFLSDGWHQREADQEAARQIAVQFGVSESFCLEILASVP